MSALGDALRARARALLGVSAYQSPDGIGLSLDDPTVERVREALGGNIQPVPTTKLHWFLDDLELAQANADSGSISMAAQLYNTMRRDGVLAGLLGTRTSGLVRLPKRFYGDRQIASVLQARNGTRSVFDDMLPPSELALLAADGIVLGVGVAELLPVEGRDFPVLVRLDPQYLQYRWSENRWYFLSTAGALPITPGDGRWVLHVPGGRMAPWRSGLWPALGRSFINKEHAMAHRSNYSAKLANPARAAVAPLGATEDQRTSFLRQVIAWGLNTVFQLPVGWDVKLIESNGKGFDVFRQEIEDSDREITIALAGQVVTTDGGAGFSNADIHRAIRADLIRDTAEGLSYTINTQVLPPFVINRWGIDALRTAPCVEWDTATPKDLATEATSLVSTANAVKSLGEALAPYARTLDIDAITTRFGVPTTTGERLAEVTEVESDAPPPEQVSDESASEPELQDAAE